MDEVQQQAILTIALQAAFADGSHDECEREQIRRLAASLAKESGTPDLMALYQQVILRQVSLDDTVAVLTEPSHRQWAYEMAVCICNADERMTEGERVFLDCLASVLRLGESVTAPVQAQVEQIADSIDVSVPPVATAGQTLNRPVEPPSAVARPSDAELDSQIVRYAILNGALELLPQSWAGMAIIPLQIRMVYGIGKKYGYDLDQGHIREMLATLGVGMTSQYIEQFGRKLLGGLFGKALGGIGKQVGKAGASIAFSFATTYALGQVAKRYYAGGRQMSSAVLRESFNNLLGPAKTLQSQYLPEIQKQAGSLDMAQVMAMIRGNSSTGL